MTRRRGLSIDRGSFAVVVVLAFGVASAHAGEPAAAPHDPVARFAKHMSEGHWGDAWTLLSDVDQAVLPRDAWVARYEALVKVPYIAVVLRSARGEGGKLVAVDWTQTRFAASVVLSDAALAASLPITTYPVRALGGKVGLGLGRLESATRAASRAEGASVSVGRGESDYFVRAAPLRARCGRGQRFLLVRVTGEGVDERLALDCTRGAEPDDPPLWATEVDAKTIRRLMLRAEVETATARRSQHPFAAPPAELVSHPAFPILP